VSESAASVKRFGFMFGAKPAQSETPVRAAAKRRPPGRGRSGRKARSYLEARSGCRCELRKIGNRMRENKKKSVTISPKFVMPFSVTLTGVRGTTWL
jgi:hypothetical protein